MDENTYPDVESFVIRYIMVRTRTDPQINYRGGIKYLQTDEELGFTDWQEAVYFINKFGPIVIETNQKGDIHAT